MFKFVVKHLGVLKYVPFFALIFDSLLFTCGLIFNRKVIECMEEIEEEVNSWKGVSVSLHKFGGRQFNVGNREIGHIHSNGTVDILFTVKIKNELIAKCKAQEHHVFKKSGWISFYIKEEKDKKDALELLRRSYCNSIK